jgi:L-alanine-DL-glutamate epimerase-like enolase superfamily enzyme
MTSIAPKVRASAGLINFRLPQAVGGSGVAAVDVIVVDLQDQDGATGLGFSYVLGGSGSVAFKAAQEQVARFVEGQSLPPPPALWRRIAASFNRTGAGPNLVALAAIDVAAWDLTARQRNVPLGAAMGGEARAVPLYGSGDFNALQSPAQAAKVAARHVSRGLQAVKPRVKGTRSDAALLEAIRSAIPDHVHVMADANEKCDLPGALWLMTLAREQGLLFVEEPLPAAAIEGYRALAAASATAVATGEHLQGRSSFLPFLSERLAAVIQPDLAMIGGLTPALELATLAEAFDVVVSPHFLPGLFLHLAAAAPALKWLEEFPLLEPVFDGWVELGGDGRMTPSNAPGHGLALRTEYRAAMSR